MFCVCVCVCFLFVLDLCVRYVFTFSFTVLSFYICIRVVDVRVMHFLLFLFRVVSCRIVCVLMCVSHIYIYIYGENACLFFLFVRLYHIFICYPIYQIFVYWVRFRVYIIIFSLFSLWSWRERHIRFDRNNLDNRTNRFRSLTKSSRISGTERNSNWTGSSCNCCNSNRSLNTFEGTGSFFRSNNLIK